jgi:hypothetical protein
MSTVFAQGAGVQRNDAESRRLLSRACELGDAAACLGSSAIEPPSGPAQTPPVQQAQGQTVTVPTAPPGYAAPSSTPGQPPAPQQHQDPVMHPTVVQAALNAVMPQFTRCYERRSRRVPMSGTVALQFRVDERGRPVDLLVHPQLTTIDDTWMRRCIQQAGGRMRFDPPPWRTSEPVIRALSFNQ